MRTSRTIHYFDRPKGQKRRTTMKNIYIENHDIITKYTGDVGVQLDKYQAEYGVAYDARGRAEYIAKFAPASLSLEQKRMLEVE